MNHMYRAIRSTSQLDISTAALLRLTLQCLKRNYCSSKEISDPLLSQGQDILLQNIKSATDVSDVLHSVKLHHRIMNNRHLMQAFRSIFILQKSDNSNLSNGEVINSSGFRVLCETLSSHVRSLDSGEVLDALKTLSYLGVPSTSKLIQILLHVLTKEINQLSLQQLLFFDFLLKDAMTSPIVEALKIALPVVIESNVRLKVDRENVPHLSDLLAFAARRNVSRETFDYLIELIMKKRRAIDLKCSKSIIRSLCDVSQPDESHRPLLHHSINVLIDHGPFPDIDFLISKLASRYSSKNNYFYHAKLLDTTSSFLLNNSCKFEEAVWHLRKLLKFGHVSTELLDKISHMIEANLSLIKDCSTLQLFTVVGGFAQADYVPRSFSLMEPIILKNALSLMDQTDLPWVKFVRDLSTLHCWPTDILSVLFTEEFLEKYLDRNSNTLDHLQLLSLHSLIASLCPEYNGPRIPPKILKKAMDLNLRTAREYPLRKYIAAALENDLNVVTRIMTQQGQILDYLVVLDNRRRPIPVATICNSPTTFLEDLPAFPDSQKIAFLHLPSSSYTANTGQPRGPTRLMMDSISSQGISVIPIASLTWDQLGEHEKCEYIQQQMRLYVPHFDAQASNQSV